MARQVSVRPGRSSAAGLRPRRRRSRPEHGGPLGERPADPHAVRRELYVAEAEAATLMGQLVWDASQRRDHDIAVAYFDQAAVAARHCGHRSAEGLALLRKSFVALYGWRNPEAGLGFTEHAARTT